LCHIRPFIDVILNLQQQQQQELPPVTSAYAQLLTEMQSIPKGSTSAHELIECISNINRRFAGTDQQDSHEFLTILLEALHDELMDNYQNSSIGDLMHGVIRSTVKCLACPEETSTDDSFLSLPLPVCRWAAETFDSNTRENICEKFIGTFISRSASDFNIHDCFQAFLSPEQLGEHGQWFCENCQNLTDATKRLDLWQLPRVLILQLNRFTCDLTNDTKIATKIRFDLQLDLSEFMKECEHDPAPLYNLVTVLTHSGTLASGHYTTFAKHLDNEIWYHFDDQHVRQASSNEVLSSDAYVLFYER
jgi:ubiquitin C-terminal hydrolase